MDLSNSPTARTVRGLNIAIIVFGALTLAGGIICLVATPFLSTALYGLDSDLEGAGATLVTVLWLGIVAILLAYAIVQLVAGVKGKNCPKNSRRLSNAFGWAVAGAIVTGLFGNWISMVLFIISAVYINTLKNETSVWDRQPYGAPGYYQQPYGQQYQQPQPQQPYAQQPQAQPAQQPVLEQPAQPDVPQPQQQASWEDQTAQQQAASQQQ